MKINLILPTYNEAENLPRLIPVLFNLPIQDLNILIIDDNSPDGTGEIAEKLALEYPGKIQVVHRKGKLGLGSAYILGFKMALENGADAIGQMDSDFSHPPEKLPELIDGINGYDIAIGSRYIKGGSLDKKWPLWRKALSAWGNFYARSILRIPTKDVTGGFRLWSRHVLENLPLERVISNGYIFQVEMAHITNLLGFQSTEIPIYFADRRWGDSKMNFKIQVEAAFRVWQVLFSYKDLKQ
ncbi:MAG: polyprenol monophosphomannose synthase [Chloroflexi bacterium]|jgi:dolichol-phosphate mannosyltransferase|nr:polyprenol monophosphomannose synthase [Chloroflexota bacterium]MBT4305855.1 polyprenol monophosphomannose synthase [Chloroflexota bacterium]MBT4533680.1 polyprenol monophosphomannose synthase [Chloroflexota bacterium]MBT4681677.1 polyprenol monophosphomannose synthase [Chloroflexota bacterium]MBT4756570.1 polyprenol monophosphomannose synthase [Chloroflexota bacterium]